MPRPLGLVFSPYLTFFMLEPVSVSQLHLMEVHLCLSVSQALCLTCAGQEKYLRSCGGKAPPTSSHPIFQLPSLSGFIPFGLLLSF